MSSSPAFASVPHAETAVLSSANSNRDGTGTLVTVFTAGANGSRVDRLVLKATGTTTAGVVRLYYHDGTNTRLLDEMLVAAVTPSGSVASWSGEFNFSDPDKALVVKAGHTLRMSVEKAETFHVVAIGGDL